ncbi:SDR family NAD(P)-dependent oxidoreductase [Paenibacillus alkalitolerans]|uniref:SDR family NAD(P)-dependent oxidoreductase n=1 Tax=Paenibacillus alkalitolerans TaxID=2799335 RepID=UPI0018F37638|nr:SDR family NAD(P)-dependent oxidoreductase [Paenibacillus alkalitolerans]
MLSLQGKVVVITGASSGIGAAAARRFAALGAVVIATARSKEKLARLSDGAEAPAGGMLFTLPLDVTSDRQVNETFEHIYAAYGTVDVLVNNAGFGMFQPVIEAPLNSFVDMMNVNYFGAVRCVKSVLPRMTAARSGHIVNVASVAGVVGTAKSAGYSATKHAVIGFTDALRQELHGTGVHVASVNPGPVNTPFFDMADPEGSYRRNVGRFMVTPERVAETIVNAVVRRRSQTFVPVYMGWGAAFIRLLPPSLFNRIASRFLNLK